MLLKYNFLFSWAGFFTRLFENKNLSIIFFQKQESFYVL